MLVNVSQANSQYYNNSGQYVEATVYVDELSGKVTIKQGVMDKQQGAAYGFYNKTLNETGWSILEIKSNQNVKIKDNDIMFAAGFLEGFLTASDISATYANIGSEWLDGVDIDKLKSFYTMQDKWMRSMIRSHTAAEDAFWTHVSYIVSQFDGLSAGYKAAMQEPDGVFILQFLNGLGDFIDLKHVLSAGVSRIDYKSMSNEEFHDYIARNGHCSAIVKVTAGFENILMSHSSWFSYSATARIFKHYQLNVANTQTASQRMSFSSYPGFLESLDDFYLLSSGLVMLQTTNNIFNESLYKLVTPRSLFAWQRVRVANMMSRSGRQWADIVQKYNSGTYNNQYMVVDLKRIQLNNSLADGSLWVVEQIPGLVVAQDQTTVLRAGYWPSYNVPFYELIFNLSGYPAIVRQRGPDYSYQLAPRAKIFRRDQGTVTDIETLKTLLRYNDFLHDKYSSLDPWNTICARGDLSHHPIPMGCYDTKVTDYQSAISLISQAINGPTTSSGLPVFQWNMFPETERHGLPDKYNFTWITTAPSL